MSEDCIACGTPADFRAYHSDLDRCARCGFVTFRKADFDPAELYDADYFAGDEYPDYAGQAPALRRSMRRHLSQMKRYTPLRGALLEIGCAYGFFLEEAERWFDPAVGVDVAADAVAFAREAGRDARTGDLLEMELERAFDVICTWDTVEHLQAPHRYVERARELLAPGGWLFLTTGDIGSVNARLRGPRWRQIHPPTHLHYFSRETMTTFLEKRGFEVRGIETAAYYHTMFNVLGSLALRGGRTGRVAEVAGAVLGAGVTTRLGLWIDLRDIMFVAARRR